MTLGSRTELLFPAHLIPCLKDLRGEVWRELVEYVSSLPETHPDTLALCLLMIRLNNCLSCMSGSYRFMRGCELCAQQTISRFQGTDEELVRFYQQARQDLARYIDGQMDELPDATIEATEPEMSE